MIKEHETNDPMMSDAIMNDPGIYIVYHKEHSKCAHRICKLSELDGLSLPRRSSLELKKDDVCNYFINQSKSKSINDVVSDIFDIISKTDKDKIDEENGMLILSSDW